MKINVIYNSRIFNYQDVLSKIERILIQQKVGFKSFELDNMEKCNFVEKQLENEISKEITFKELRPGEFKVYKMI